MAEHTTCSIEDCDRPARHSGMCHGHRNRLQRDRLIAFHLPCTIPDCTRARYARDLCATHYARWRLWGDPLKTLRKQKSRDLTTEEWFWQRVNKNGPIPQHCPELGPCWLWEGPTNKSGYGKLNFIEGGKLRTVTAHRYAYVPEFGEPPENTPDICHHCDVRLCVRGTHFFAGTHQSNRADCVAKGRQARGETHGSVTHPESRVYGERAGMSKLRDADIQEIRERYAKGDVSQATLATEYGVYQTVVSTVIRRKTWKHIN